MWTVATGAVVFVLTAVAFWYCLPRDGKYHRFVGTELEPYVGVAFCAAIALSFTMILSGIIDAGAYYEFNPSIERVAERLPRLFETVIHCAIGGPAALKALSDESADLLLEQIK